MQENKKHLKGTYYSLVNLLYSNLSCNYYCSLPTTIRYVTTTQCCEICRDQSTSIKVLCWDFFGLGLFWHLSFRQETFMHGHFITRTFQQEDISAQEHFGMCNLRHHGHFGTGTLWHCTGTFGPRNISAHWHFSPYAEMSKISH